MIQICTQLWPEPGPHMQRIQDFRYPMGVVDVPVLEIERRKDHIDKIDPNHALLPIAVDCLHYNENRRSSSEELCKRLADLKESREYRESVENHFDEIQAKNNLTRKTEQLQEKDRLLRHKAIENATLIQQLHEKDKALLDKDDQLQQQGDLLKIHQEEIASQERQQQQLNQSIQDKDRLLQQREDELISKNQQLQDKDIQLQHKVTENAMLIQQLHEKDKRLLDKDDQLQQQGKLLKLHQEEKTSQEKHHQQLNQSIQDKDRLLQQREREIISKN